MRLPAIILLTTGLAGGVVTCLQNDPYFRRRIHIGSTTAAYITMQTAGPQAPLALIVQPPGDRGAAHLARLAADTGMQSCVIDASAARPFEFAKLVASVSGKFGMPRRVFLFCLSESLVDTVYRAAAEAPGINVHVVGFVRGHPGQAATDVSITRAASDLWLVRAGDWPAEKPAVFRCILDTTARAFQLPQTTRPADDTATSFVRYLPWGGLCMAALLWNHFARSARAAVSTILGRRRASKTEVLAGAAIAIVMADIAAHAYILNRENSGYALKAARMHVIPATLRTSFEQARGIAGEQALIGELLDHAKLAQLQAAKAKRDHSDDLFLQYVLSPRITAHHPATGWRGPLWRSIGAHVNVKSGPDFAARGVRSRLLQRVTILDRDSCVDPLEIWQRGYCDSQGFSCLYVAALRATGLPARLHNDRTVQLWSHDGWRDLPHTYEVTFVNAAGQAPAEIP